MIAWKQFDAWAANANLGHPGSGGAGTFEQILIVDSDRNPANFLLKGQHVRDVPAVPFCGSVRENGVANLTRKCLPACDGSDGLGFNLTIATHGACHGTYQASDMLMRTRYALCLRGDIPSSPRPYDAMRYGAIPLIVSDHIYRVALPFQCWVPWKLLVVTISESKFSKDVNRSLMEAIQLAPQREARMRQLIAHFGKDVLWRHPKSRVAENFLLAAYRWRARAQPLLGCCPMEDQIAFEVDER